METLQNRDCDGRNTAKMVTKWKRKTEKKMSGRKLDGDWRRWTVSNKLDNGDDERVLTQMLDSCNPLVKVFRSIRERAKSSNIDNLRLRLIKKRNTDSRVYNLPTASEVAALIVGDFDIENVQKDIIVENKYGLLQRIHEMHPLYLPMQYPLLFPYDEKFNTTAQINTVISAEILDPETEPRLYEAVKTFMIHDPCGSERKSSPCMVSNKCSKHFPKKFTNRTLFDQDGEPSVEHLPFHLPNEQGIIFNDDDPIEDVVNDATIKETKFLAWFEANKRIQKPEDIALANIENMLRLNDRSLKDYPPKSIPNDSIMDNMTNVLMSEELNYDRELLRSKHDALIFSLTSEQRNIYDLVMNVVNNSTGELFFVSDFGGSWKTYIWNTLTSGIRSNGLIVLTVASSGIASQLIPGGKTAHSSDRAILSPTLDDVAQVNDYMLGLLTGEERIFLSFDSISNQDPNPKLANVYTTKFLNTISGSGLPYHELKLKVGAPIMLLRNIDRSLELCNGTRLIVSRMCDHVIEATIVSGKFSGCGGGGSRRRFIFFLSLHSSTCHRVAIRLMYSDSHPPASFHTLINSQMPRSSDSNKPSLTSFTDLTRLHSKAMAVVTYKMGGKSDNGNIQIEWSTQNTKLFIDLIFDRVNKKQLQTSTFKQTIWEEINNELAKIIEENYGVKRLKVKFNRLRTQYQEFSTLLARTGVTWDSISNKVNALEDVWQDLYTKGRYYKQFKKNGFEYDYDMLGEIFNNSTISGKLSHASTQEPPTSNEERLLEDDFLSKGVHVDSQFIDVEGENSNLIGDKRKQTFRSSSERHRKDSKLSRFDKLEASLNKWTEVMDIKKEAAIAKMKRYKKQANETNLTPYSIDACMELLDSMDDVSSKIYNSALENFKDEDWKVMLVKMPAFRRKVWTSILTGRMYTIEFLTGHEARCYESFRMNKVVFQNLCDVLKDVGKLSDGKDVTVEEGVAMFLIIIGQNLCHRIVAERFQHSLYIVSKWFRRVLRAACVLGTRIIKLINQGTIHKYILENPKYFLYFKNCIGALDGTHVSAWAPTTKQTAFRGKNSDNTKCDGCM
ncbi:putative nuclease HARBI1 [Senna tora]|uniref:ATP-dependent DNA helicase n=1 Tax=Senna tora TaxID=362788 RepID=A0A834W7A0_9FABA|nr:putative nuclease HARBI1 [Senna tora]